jgi:pimeloyl-ACP methyl ester carboxylesterase
MAALNETLKVMREKDPLVTPAFLRMIHETPGYDAFCDAKLLASAPAMWLAMSKELLAQADRLDALAHVGVPTLVVAGEQDTPFVAHSERMAKTIPGARLVVVADAGHSPQFEARDSWWDALTSFLDNLS